jgi:hypothetical protein
MLVAPQTGLDAVAKRNNPVIPLVGINSGSVLKNT